MVNGMKSIRPVTLREQVFEEIQQAILEQRLKPGDHIREHELTKLLQVSRTPVREALVLLERDGLVEIAPNRGCFVREFDAQDIREIFAMRTALEDMAAELIVGQLGPQQLAYLEGMIAKQQAAGLTGPGSLVAGMVDLEFHKYLVTLAGNSRLLRTWQAIAIQYTIVFSYLDSVATTDGRRLAIESHQAILAALRDGDSARIGKINRIVNTQMAERCVAGYLARQAEVPVI